MTMMRLLGLVLAVSGHAGAGIAAELPWSTERKIIGTSELEPVEDAIGTPLYGDARAVARVEDDLGVGFCTSVRVGKDLFLTNFHCFDFKPCENLRFHLGFEKALPLQSQLVLKCKEILAKNMTFDYALFRVESVGTVPKAVSEGLLANATLVLEDSADPGVGPRIDSFPVATLWTGPVAVGQTLFVAGHPEARFKEIDRGSKCKLRSTVPELIEERLTITHTCDTEGGSSGSPVMDRASGYVVALHWGGKEGDNFNMAIPMTEIVPDLQKSLPAETFSELQIVSK